jgi:hypothetical protein
MPGFFLYPQCNTAHEELMIELPDEFGTWFFGDPIPCFFFFSV